MYEQMKQQPLLKSPFVVCLWIADQCNLECRYCYAMPFSGRIMERERMLILADELIELEVIDITLAGGEPFLNPGIFSLIDRLLSGGANIGVLSNGTTISNNVRKKLVDVVGDRDNFLLQVSLDGVTQSTHDKTRGMGRKTIENLDCLCAETDIRLQIATVLNAHNICEVTKLIEKYYPRVKRYHFMNLQRTDKSLQNDDMFVSEKRNKQFWEELEHYMNDMPNDILVTGLNLMRLMHRMEEDPSKYCLRSSFTCRSCTAGVTHIEITSDFTVIGCDIAKDYTAMGNVANKTLKEVWDSKEAEMVRNYPFPACYLVKDPIGRCLADNLPNGVRDYAEQVKNMA